MSSLINPGKVLLIFKYNNIIYNNSLQKVQLKQNETLAVLVAQFAYFNILFMFIKSKCTAGALR